MSFSQTELSRIFQDISKLYPKKIDLGLNRILALLKKLGHPERNLSSVIHVAGTNGKGSMIAFLKSILLAYKPESVHVYTSPHLVRYNERIQLNGKYISDKAFLQLLKRVEYVNKNDSITFFELLTATAFLAFSEHFAEYTLVETGLGGRFDATNVFDAPKACIITPVSFDHMKFLGSSLHEIAFEKAGILKPKCQTFTAQNDQICIDVIQKRAEKLSAPIAIFNQDFQCYEQNNRLVYQDQSCLLDLPLPSLYGRYQYQNLALAIACARYLGVSESAIEQGIKKAVWPARLQLINPLPKYLKNTLPDIEIWLDGSHNPDGARVISEAMMDLEKKSSRPLMVILGMGDNKDAKSWLGYFQNLVSKLIAIPIKDHLSISPEILVKLARELGIESETSSDVMTAISSIIDPYLPSEKSNNPSLKKMKTNHLLARNEAPIKNSNGIFLSNKKIAPRILITGSLYLAGHVLKMFDLEP